MSKDEAGNNSYEVAYNRIKQQILNVEIPPGEGLSELRLSHELGISRTPVREALRILEQEGLVVSHNGRKKVAILTSDDLKDIFELKISIEGLIVENAARLRTEKDIKTLRAISGDMEHLARRISVQKEKFDYFSEWKILNSEFHTTLYRIAGNKRAGALVDNLNLQWHRWRMGVMAMEWRVERNIREHEAIADAIIDGDPDTAKKAMKEHLDDLYNTVDSIIKTFGIK